MFLRSILFSLCAFFAFLFVSTCEGLSYSDQNKPSFVIDSSGNITAVWVAIDSNTGNHLIRGRTKSVNGNWGEISDLSSSIGQDASEPHIVIDGSDNITVAWINYDATRGAYCICAREKPAKKKWQNLAIVTVGNSISDCDLQTSFWGELVLMWSSHISNSPYSEIYTSYATFGDSWSIPEAVSQ